MPLTTIWRTRLYVVLLLCLLLPGAFALQSIPASADVLDLRSLGRLLISALLGVPIRLLDACTGGAFAARNEGFLGFPSGVQLGFALFADLLVFSVIAWALVRPRAQRGPEVPPAA
jgi:hypothetical protein